MIESVGDVVDPLRELAEMVAAVGDLDQGVDDSIRVDRLRLLEELKAAAAAAQAREAAAFAASQKAAQLAAGVPAERAERGIASQIALALRCSPWKAQRYVGWARVLIAELPHTLELLRCGRVPERRALIVARETIWLSREDRAAVDAELAARLEQLGDRRAEAAVKTIAYRLDPEGFVARVRAAEKDRYVSLRPAPDAMVRLTGLLPVAQGVACYASLSAAADTSTASGDERGRGQLMADTLVQRLTGQATADAVPVEVNLVMTDRSLLTPDGDGGDEPAVVNGEIVPAGIARALVLDASDETPVWLRRLYTAPRTGELVAMDSARRTFTGAQRRFITLRDQICRTPWCDAPIRHIDHITPAGHGGPTRIDNGQGYCQTCNHAKQAPGWTTTVTSRDGPHEVRLTTPTGHAYNSRAPDPPRAA